MSKSKEDSEGSSTVKTSQENRAAIYLTLLSRIPKPSDGVRVGGEGVEQAGAWGTREKKALVNNFAFFSQCRRGIWHLFGFSFHSEQKVLAINIWSFGQYKLVSFPLFRKALVMLYSWNSPSHLLPFHWQLIKGWAILGRKAKGLYLKYKENLGSIYQGVDT